MFEEHYVKKAEIMLVASDTALERGLARGLRLHLLDITAGCSLPKR